MSRQKNVRFKQDEIPVSLLNIPKPGVSLAVCAQADLEQIRNDLVMDKLAKSSQKIFANQLQWWTLFCRVKGVEPLWRGNSPSLERENLVLDYIVHTGVVISRHQVPSRSDLLPSVVTT